MLNIICNPIAGKNKASKNIKKVSKYLKKEKIPYLVYFSEKPDDISTFASELYKAGEKEFIIVGGDGTIHNFINAIPDLSQINIGIIPSGIQNNFAKSAMLETNPVLAIQNILNNKIEKFDIVKCNDIKSINCIAFGAVELVKHSSLKNGKPKNPNIFDKMKGIKSFEPIQINFSGEEIKDKNINILQCYIANGNFKGKLKISPLSNVQDGLANIICVTAKENKSRISEYINIKAGKHIYSEENKIYWAPKVNISTSVVPVMAEIDGEIIELNQLNIQILEKAINIFV
ncbi:MAG: hypothetical protein IJX26_00240 [Clostridia bacterium]|nr:hypothetical protein [Clostridia bacterium]